MVKHTLIHVPNFLTEATASQHFGGNCSEISAVLQSNCNVILTCVMFSMCKDYVTKVTYNAGARGD